MAIRCTAQGGNNFTLTGKGDLPENSTVKLTRMTLWADLRVPQRRGSEKSIAENNLASYSPIVEATGCELDEFGSIELVAIAPKNFEDWQQMPNCEEVPVRNN